MIIKKLIDMFWGSGGGMRVTFRRGGGGGGGDLGEKL
jgi:hypothetical protein